ncbi:MAG: PEPxxWA-CTERM sorting domain-containing protein, partial [Candidatus Dormibacteria bacterium]
QGLNWPGDSVFISESAGVNASTDLIGPGFFDLCGAGNGNCVDLDGSTGSGHDPAGQLQSVASFAPGTYTVHFDLGGNQRGTPSESTTVSLGSFSTTLTPASNTEPMTLHSFTFTTATGGNLVFTENGPSDQIGNLLDNVSLATGVPEPATWAFMIAGFGLAGFGLRRARRRSALA